MVHLAQVGLSGRSLIAGGTAVQLSAPAVNIAVILNSSLLPTVRRNRPTLPFVAASHQWPVATYYRPFQDASFEAESNTHLDRTGWRPGRHFSF
ncbi:protein of unknown function (plasmid) [Caballeronia sp. S22]